MRSVKIFLCPVVVQYTHVDDEYVLFLSVKSNRHKLQFSFTFHEPLTKTLFHSFPASPAAIVDCRDDLEGLEPLDKTLQLQKAAVLAVRNSCKENQNETDWSLKSCI